MPSVETWAGEARAIGNVKIKGGFLGNGSTSSSGAPSVPTITFGTSPAQPRWAGFLALHDAETGIYDVLLDDDWYDLLPVASAQTNMRWIPGYVYVPSTTTGSGVILTQTSPTNAQIQVVVASASGSSTTAALSSGVLTITPQSSGGAGSGGAGANSDVATYINAHTSTLKVSACVVGTATDVANAQAATVGLFTSPGVNGYGMSNASVFVQSTTAGKGITFTAATAGDAGNGITIVFSGTGGLSVAVVGNVITFTLATSGASNTNALIGGLVVATAAVVALVSVTLVGTVSDQMVANAGTLSGGGAPVAQVVGQVNPNANKANGFNIPILDLSALSKNSIQNVHFRIAYSEGNQALDRTTQSQIFLPSTTYGDGVLISSGSTGPVAAALSVQSTTANNGFTVTANTAGDSGNNIAIELIGPYATVFVPSTTGGDGILFTAVTAGALGTAISVTMNAPSGSTSTVQVIGTQIICYPKTGETNGGMNTVLAASGAVTALVGMTVTGSTDLISSTAFGPKNLSGGNSNASGAATASVVGNLQNGSTIVVQFGTSTTNTTVVNAINATGSASAALVTAAVYNSTGSDDVVATSLTYLGSGATVGSMPAPVVGFTPEDLQLAVKTGSSASPTAAISGNVLTVSLGTTNTNNTNAKIALAINEVALSATTPTFLAAWVGSSSDVTVSGYTLPATNLVCNDIIMFSVEGRKSSAGPY